jgi:hypothetical protein
MLAELLLSNQCGKLGVRTRVTHLPPEQLYQAALVFCSTWETSPYISDAQSTIELKMQKVCFFCELAYKP